MVMLVKYRILLFGWFTCTLSTLLQFIEGFISLHNNNNNNLGAKKYEK
jgi:hypothetical protein